MSGSCWVILVSLIVALAAIVRVAILLERLPALFSRLDELERKRSAR